MFKKKYKNFKLALLIMALAGTSIAVTGCGSDKSPNKSNGKNNPIIYNSRNGFRMDLEPEKIDYDKLMNGKKKGPFEDNSIGINNKVNDLKGLNDVQFVQKFTPDGKYVYFMPNMGIERGDLYRAECSKLRPGSDTETRKYNEACFELVAEDIGFNYKLFDDGSVLYKRFSNELYLYDGEETRCITDTLRTYSFDDAGKVVYIEERKVNDRFVDDLKGFKVSEPDNIKIIKEDVYRWSLRAGPDDIKYIVYNKDGRKVAYEAGFDKEEKEIMQDAFYCYYGNGKHYLFKANGKRVYLYDYASDAKSKSQSVVDKLKSDGYSKALFDMYCYQDGNAEKVLEDIISADFYGSNHLVCKTATNQKPMSLSEASNDIDEFRYNIYETDRFSFNEIISTLDNSVYLLSEEAKSFIEPGIITHGDETFYHLIGDKLYLESQNQGLFVAQIKDGIVGEFESVAVDGKLLYVDGDILYYTDNSRYGNSGKVCDLHKCTNSEDILVAEAIDKNTLSIYEDGYIFAISSPYGEGNLVKFSPSGEKEILDMPVDYFVRVSEDEVMVSSKGLLIGIKGEEKYVISPDTKIYSFNCKNSMPCLNRTNWIRRSLWAYDD